MKTVNSHIFEITVRHLETEEKTDVQLVNVRTNLVHVFKMHKNVVLLQKLNLAKTNFNFSNYVLINLNYMRHPSETQFKK